MGTKDMSQYRSETVVQQLIHELDQAEQKTREIKTLYEQSQERIQHLEAELLARSNELCNTRRQLLKSYDATGQHKSRYFDLSPIGMASIQADLTWLEINSTLCKILGYDCDSLMHRPITAMMHPDDVATMQSMCTLLQEDNQNNATFDIRFVHQDNRIIYTNIILHRFHNPDTASWTFLCLIQDITKRKQAEDDLRIFETIIRDTSVGIAVATLDATIIYHNRAFCHMHGYADAVGMKNIDFIAEDGLATLLEINPALQTQGTWNGIIQSKRSDGSTFPAQLSLSLISDSVGEPHLISVIVHDHTAIEQAEQERASLQEQIILMQESAIRELSSPLLPIAEQVVIMPLVGSIDSGRAQQIMDTLLEGVAYHRAEWAIIDLTGIHVADTQVATTLVMATRAAELLGAVVVVTGIAPAMAETLVHLGTNLQSIVTLSTLQEGIQYTLKQQRQTKRKLRQNKQQSKH